MDKERLRNYCLERRLNEKTIQAHMKIARARDFFENKASKPDFTNATFINLQMSVKHLMQEIGIDVQITWY